MSEATETPASLRALAEHLESKPTEYEHGKAAELRARAAEMEREFARPQPQAAGKPSAGPWAYDEADGNIYAPDGAPVGQVFDNVDDGTKGLDDEDSIHNGRLFAEAGTVHHETGLTPRQLAEENERLKRWEVDQAKLRDGLTAQLEDALAALREIVDCPDDDMKGVRVRLPFRLEAIAKGGK